MGVISVIWSPVRTLRQTAEERNTLAGFLVVAAAAVIGLLTSAVFVFTGLLQTQFEDILEASQGQIPPALQENFVAFAGISSITFAVLWPFAVWVMISLVMQLVTRFFGGEGPLSAMFAVIGVAYVPYLISALVSVPIQALQVTMDPTAAAAQLLGVLSGLLSIAFFAWFAILVVIGAAQARNISFGESTGSCAISCAGCIGLIIGVVVVLAVVASVIAAAGSQ